MLRMVWQQSSNIAVYCFPGWSLRRLWHSGEGCDAALVDLLNRHLMRLVRMVVLEVAEAERSMH